MPDTYRVTTAGGETVRVRAQSAETARAAIARHGRVVSHVAPLPRSTRKRYARAVHAAVADTHGWVVAPIAGSSRIRYGRGRTMVEVEYTAAGQVRRAWLYLCPTGAPTDTVEGGPGRAETVSGWLSRPPSDPD